MRGILYVRDPAMYPGSDPLGYAAELGCRGVALQPRIRRHREMIDEAVGRFGGEAVTLYDLPSEYLPDNWRPTLARAVELAQRHGCGVLVDAEEAPIWMRHEAESIALGEEIARLSASGEVEHIGLTSFPSHPRWGMWAELSRRAGASSYGSVQLYGSASYPTSRYEGEIRDWSDKWPGGARVSVALGTWARNPMTPGVYMDYLDAVSDAITIAGAHRSVFLWHARPPEPGSAYYVHMRAWLAEEPAPTDIEGETPPSEPRRERSRKGLWALAALGVAGAAAAAMAAAKGC